MHLRVFIGSLANPKEEKEKNKHNTYAHTYTFGDILELGMDLNVDFKSIPGLA